MLMLMLMLILMLMLMMLVSRSIVIIIIIIIACDSFFYIESTSNVLKMRTLTTPHLMVYHLGWLRGEIQAIAQYMLSTRGTIVV